MLSVASRYHAFQYVMDKRPVTEAAIYFANLQKSYGDLSVLKGINGQIQRGEVVAIIGSSGCGKSTQLHDAILLPNDRDLNYDIVVEIEDQAVATNQKTKCAWLRKSNAVGFVTSGEPTYASGSLQRCHDTT